MLSGEYSKFYNFVNNKYSCKSPEWNERLTSCDKYIGLLKKIENIANFQTIFNKKHEENENGYKVGDVFYSSWGYEQTNIDFYQVIATSKKLFGLQKLKQMLIMKAGVKVKKVLLKILLHLIRRCLKHFPTHLKLEKMILLALFANMMDALSIFQMIIKQFKKRKQK